MCVKEIFQEAKKIQESKKSAEQKLSLLSVFAVEQLMQCPCNTISFFIKPHKKVRIRYENKIEVKIIIN